ncbi:hypothetical protein Lal_00027279 [Lupinus albus]|nr:hypothetical protein Lal_00027279 [Lupinus albus]
MCLGSLINATTSGSRLSDPHSRSSEKIPPILKTQICPSRPGEGNSRPGEASLAQARILQPRQVQNVTFLAQARPLSLKRESFSIAQDFTLPGCYMFHVRCCAHVLNLLVKDGRKEINDVIYNIRESVKYIIPNNSRLKTICDVVEQKHLKEMKLVIDCPTIWNSTFDMLPCALKFKTFFASYKDKEPHYNYAPSNED